MNGDRAFLLDTNVIIDFLKGCSADVQFILSKERSLLAISQITRIEILSHESITEDAEKLINAFFRYITVIPITLDIERETILLRRKMKLKTPDAIIAASAIVERRTLVTRDKRLLKIESPRLKMVSPD